MTSTFAIGDIHGHIERLVFHLRDVGLVGSSLEWEGADTRIWFLGDLFDRGPDGIACIDLIMRLQKQAARDRGFVQCLLGNHDTLLLSAYKFPDSPTTGEGKTFLGDWKLNGGVESDLERLRPEHVEWLVRRPALAREGSTLLAHADLLFYLEYGDSIEDVNRSIERLLRSRDIARWDTFLEAFAQHREFADFAPDGREKAQYLLRTLHADTLVHAHSPIDKFVGKHAEEITKPLVYAGGLCVNVDGGMYRGGPGFIYRLPDTTPSHQAPP